MTTATQELINIPANRLVTPHFVRVETANGLQHYTLTGIALVDFKGVGGDWRRDSVQVQIPIPAIPAGRQFRAIHWAPNVALAAIANDGTAVNAGYAVDAFGLDTPHTPRRAVFLNADLAVRDIDGIIYRLTYDITLLGEFVAAA